MISFLEKSISVINLVSNLQTEQLADNLLSQYYR